MSPEWIAAAADYREFQKVSREGALERAEYSSSSRLTHSIYEHGFPHDHRCLRSGEIGLSFDVMETRWCVQLYIAQKHMFGTWQANSTACNVSGGVVSSVLQLDSAADFA